MILAPFLKPVTGIFNPSLHCYNIPALCLPQVWLVFNGSPARAGTEPPGIQQAIHLMVAIDPLINSFWEQLFKQLSMGQDKQSLPTFLHIVHEEIPKDLLKSLDF